jgi:YD repeat-containing protein
MANKTIPELPPAPLPLAGGEVGVIDDGTTTYRHDLRYWGLASASMAYNPDGTIASVTRAGRTTTFTYASGRLTGASDGVVARAFGYDGGGNLTSVNVS